MICFNQGVLQHFKVILVQTHVLAFNYLSNEDGNFVSDDTDDTFIGDLGKFFFSFFIPSAHNWIQINSFPFCGDQL